MKNNKVLLEACEMAGLALSVDRHKPDDESPTGLLYELELFDLSGEGSYVQWFQQYEGDPEGKAESELEDFLKSYKELTVDSES